MTDLNTNGRVPAQPSKVSDVDRSQAVTSANNSTPTYSMMQHPAVQADRQQEPKDDPRYYGMNKHIAFMSFMQFFDIAPGLTRDELLKLAHAVETERPDPAAVVDFSDERERPERVIEQIQPKPGEDAPDPRQIKS
jgi:hypothetical protein